MQIFDPFDNDGDSDDRTLCQMAAFRTSSGCSYEWECVDIPLSTLLFSTLLSP